MNIVTSMLFNIFVVIWGAQSIRLMLKLQASHSWKLNYHFVFQDHEEDSLPECYLRNRLQEEGIYLGGHRCGS